MPKKTDDPAEAIARLRLALEQVGADSPAATAYRAAIARHETEVRAAAPAAKYRPPVR